MFGEAGFGFEASSRRVFSLIMQENEQNTQEMLAYSKQRRWIGNVTSVDFFSALLTHFFKRKLFIILLQKEIMVDLESGGSPLFPPVERILESGMSSRERSAFKMIHNETDSHYFFTDIRSEGSDNGTIKRIDFTDFLKRESGAKKRERLEG